MTPFIIEGKHDGEVFDKQETAILTWRAGGFSGQGSMLPIDGLLALIIGMR